MNMINRWSRWQNRAAMVMSLMMSLSVHADREEKINRDFGLSVEKVQIRRVAEEGIETILNSGNEPIQVNLEPGVERRLVFPQPVLVGLKNGMSEALTVQNVDRTVFLTAMTSIAHTRLLVRHTDESQTYVLNVSTEGVSGRHTALMIQPRLPAKTIAAPAKSKMIVPRLNQRREDTASGYGVYVKLTRFAAQQVYGPQRLAEVSVSVSAVKKLDTVNTVAIVRGDRITATPIASWTDGVYSVTAIELKNHTDEPVVLDPRELRGRWLAATFHSNQLTRRGEAGDVTALYVVSDSSFDNALGVVR